MRGRRKLKQNEVDILLSLYARGGAVLPTALRTDERAAVLPLWRLGLVELWFRRPPAERAPMQGPFWRLSPQAAELAANHPRQT